MNHHTNLRARLLTIGIACLMALTSTPMVDATSSLAPGIEESALQDSTSHEADLTTTPTSTKGIYFEENLGQFPSHVRYVVHGAGLHAFLTNGGATFVLSEEQQELEEASMGPGVEELRTISRTEYAVSLEYVQSSVPISVGSGLLPSYSNHYTADPSNWVTHAPHYEQVTQSNVWPGIDVLWYGEAAKGLKFDIIVHPGADPDQVVLEADGAQALLLQSDGRLLIETPLGDLVKDAPYTYQEDATSKNDVDNQYRLDIDNRFTFDVGEYDASKRLVIDPFIYSTYLGGSSDDDGMGIAIDSSGNTYIAGTASSTNFPIVNGYQTTHAGSGDAYYAKLDATGSLVYSTYLGGTSNEDATVIGLDSSGNVYLGGDTISDDFPILNAHQPNRAGGWDAFLAKFTPAGGLTFSTYYGGGTNIGSHGESVFGMGIDSSDNVYITGTTQSTDFPVLNAHQSTFGGGSSWGSSDAFVTKFDSAGVPVYSTYLGGSDGEQGFGITVDSSGNAYVTGNTRSTDFPTLNAYRGSNAGERDAFVTKFSSTGSLLQSTYIGGSNNDFGRKIVISPSGVVYAVGTTTSSDFPTVNPKQGSHAGGTYDAYLVRFSSLGYPSYSSYLGGSGKDFGRGLAFDANNIFLVGYTDSTNLPNVIQGGLAGSSDAFVSKLNYDGTVAQSIYVGGADTEQVFGNGIQVDSSGHAYITGRTRSTDFPTANAYQGSIAGGFDAFITKLHPDQVLPSISNAPQSWSWQNTIPTLTGVTWQDTDSGLDASAQYSVGTTSGATDVVAWTTMPQQPTQAQTSTWTPSWSPSSLAQGTNYVNTRVLDVAGNVKETSGAYVVEYDSNTPIVSGNPADMGWTNTSPTLSGVSWQDAVAGLAASATYSVGSTSGAIDIQDWMVMPVQPVAGQSSAWSPEWNPSSMGPGTNYVNVRVQDRSGNELIVNGAYVFQYETSPPLIMNAGQSYSWTNQIPDLSGVSWQDTSSGLDQGAQYSIGLSSGATDVQDWGDLPVQPVQGQTTAWSPSWTPPTLGQGTNYVQTRVSDTAGNQLSSTDVYTVQFDDLGDAVTGLAARTGPGESLLTEAQWQPDNSPFFEWSASSGTSPVQGYSILLTQDDLAMPNTAVDTSGTSADYTTASLADGTWYFRVQALDAAGNWGPVSSYQLLVDASSTVATGAPVVTAWSNANPLLGAVCFQDQESGLDSNSRYWLGSTPGTSDLRPATSMPVQPTQGQETPWCPDFQVDAASLQQGSNHVTVETTNVAGVASTTQSHEIRFDDEWDTVEGLKALTEEGGTELQVGVWHTDATPYFEWTATSTSPIAGYSLLLDEVTIAEPDNVPNTTTPSYSPGVLADGEWLMQVRSVDEAGNWGATSAVQTWIDTAAPTSSGAPLTTAWSSSSPTLSGICFQDVHAGLAANAVYWVGSQPGLADLQASSALPVQPTTGLDTAWCPAFAVPEGSLAVGSSYVTIQVEDTLGHPLVTESYVVLYDAAVPSTTGGPIDTAWQNSNPTLQGVCFQDSDVGLESARYWMGSSAGGSDLLSARTLPVQPTSGDTSLWCPVFEVEDGFFAQGLNFVSVEVTDALGNLLVVDAYRIRFDDVGDVVPMVTAKTSSTGTSILEGVWQSDNTPYFAWTMPDSTSPITGYSHDFDVAPDDVQESGNAFLDVLEPLADGVHVFNVKSVDEAGNWGVVKDFEIQVDAASPVSTGAPVVWPWKNYSPQVNGVCFQDVTSGLAANAQYRVGSLPGTGAWTTLASQPVVNPTGNWCPVLTVPEADLVQGVNYVDIKVTDKAGNELIVQAYQVRFDNVPDVVDGITAHTESGGTALLEKTWNEDRTPFFDWSASSTSPITGYSVSLSESGSAPDEGPDQVAPGYQAALGALSTANGKWSFQVRVIDEAGNVGFVAENSTFAYWLDDLGPVPGFISSSTHTSPALYYNRTTATLSWGIGATDYDGSGIAGYATEIVPPGGIPSDLSLKPTNPTPTATFTDVGPFGSYTFRVQAVDNVGHWGPVKTRVVNVDTIQPEYTLEAPSDGFVSPNARQPIVVRYRDLDVAGGVTGDPLEAATKVDAASVLLFVDGVPIRDVWEPICGPDGPLYGVGCRLDITSSGIDYEPLLPWSEGPHDVFVQIQDTVVDANTATADWTWTFRALQGVDPDQDLLPEDVEALACNDPGLREVIETLGECTGDDYAAGFTITVPVWATPGPDGDEDGIPAYVSLQQENVTFDPDAESPITREPVPDKIIQVDPNDNDDSNPNACNTLIEDSLLGGAPGVLIVLCGQSVPNVLIGVAPECFDLEDNDGDGITDYRPLLTGGGDAECTSIFDNDEAN